MQIKFLQTLLLGTCVAGSYLPYGVNALTFKNETQTKLMFSLSSSRNRYEDGSTKSSYGSLWAEVINAGATIEVPQTALKEASLVTGWLKHPAGCSVLTATVEPTVGPLDKRPSWKEETSRVIWDGCGGENASAVESMVVSVTERGKTNPEKDQRDMDEGGTGELGLGPYTMEVNHNPAERWVTLNKELGERADNSWKSWISHAIWGKPASS